MSPRHEGFTFLRNDSSLALRGDSTLDETEATLGKMDARHMQAASSKSGSCSAWLIRGAHLRSAVFMSRLSARDRCSLLLQSAMQLSHAQPSLTFAPDYLHSFEGHSPGVQEVTLVSTALALVCNVTAPRNTDNCRL